jgi:hypothetical protein
MPRDLWLPRGYELPDGSKTASLLFSGKDWQIFSTNGNNRILLVRPKLALRWNESGFLSEPILIEFTFGSEPFYILSSGKKFVLAPVSRVQFPDNKIDALAFALALKESRKFSNDASFHDAIYVEQFSKLLPTWTLTPHVDDKTVLGTWLTGGVVISTDSFRRLTHLMGWMPANDLTEIIETAGFNVQIETDAKPHSEQSMPKREGEFFRLPGRPKLDSVVTRY